MVLNRTLLLSREVTYAATFASTELGVTFDAAFDAAYDAAAAALADGIAFDEDTLADVTCDLLSSAA